MFSASTAAGLMKPESGETEDPDASGDKITVSSIIRARTSGERRAVKVIQIRVGLSLVIPPRH